MKTYILSLLSHILVLAGMAQTSDSLIAISRNNYFYSGHLLSNTKSFITQDTLHFLGINGCHTYNPRREEMFVKINNRVLQIDARSGRLIDTLATDIHLNFIEADINSNNLIGLGNTGSGAAVYSIDMATKMVTLVNIIPELTSIHASSAMNLPQSILYVKSNLGIACIDVATGTLIDTIFEAVNLDALEYHPGTKLLYGIDGYNRAFYSLDPITKTYTYIASCSTISEIASTSTMDILGSRFVVRSNLGITFKIYKTEISAIP